jgi:hypothetical protein
VLAASIIRAMRVKVNTAYQCPKAESAKSITTRIIIIIIIIITGIVTKGLKKIWKQYQESIQ